MVLYLLNVKKFRCKKKARHLYAEFLSVLSVAESTNDIIIKVDKNTTMYKISSNVLIIIIAICEYH